MSDAFVQTYLRSKGYFVSTIYRQSSAMLAPDRWYYETIVWEWDEDARDKGKLLHSEDSGSGEMQAFRRHLHICDKLMSSGIEGFIKSTEDES